MEIRRCAPDDIEAICDIYNHYIRHTSITFEETPLSLEEMQARVESYTKQYPWFVCVDEGVVVGYAYASRWRERAAYRHTAETTVYIRNGHCGKGHGKALYAQLLSALFQSGCHVALGCIALPNDASIALHEQAGFRKVAQFSEVGYKFGQWLDVGYWQRINPATAP